MNNERLGIYNEFGIIPSKNHDAAGYDFYIPKITDKDDLELVYDALYNSYKSRFTRDEFNDIVNYVQLILTSMTLDIQALAPNIVHLYLATTNSREPKIESLHDSIDDFTQTRLVFSITNDVYCPGIRCKAGDYYLFNSGLRVRLPKDTAGIFYNKSGKGNTGFDVRACVVDEDYSGLVHLSAAYDKDVETTLFCGDKLLQFIITPLYKTDIQELDKDSYNELMSGSERGSDGFGSSDVKH